MSSKVVFILGAGANIGSAVAKKFFDSGFKVAVASRTNSQDFNNYTHVKVDLDDPTSVPAAFDSVRKSLGEPNIVIYNAAASKFVDKPFSLPLNDLQTVFNINTLSPYIAIGEALKGFEKVEGPKVFIYTGNRLNVEPFAPFLSLGTTKSAAAHMIAYADQVYKPMGLRFFFADERTIEGRSASTKINGPGHAEFYYELAQGVGLPWHATFVIGHGYKDFGEIKV